MIQEQKAIQNFTTCRPAALGIGSAYFRRRCSGDFDAGRLGVDARLGALDDLDEPVAGISRWEPALCCVSVRAR